MSSIKLFVLVTFLVTMTSLLSFTVAVGLDPRQKPTSGEEDTSVTNNTPTKVPGGIFEVAQVQAVVIQLIEDLAEDYVNRCHRQGIDMEYEALKMDMNICLNDSLAEFAKVMTFVSVAVTSGQPLTVIQKTNASTEVLIPFCGSAKLAMTECRKPEYTFLATTFEKCRTKGERVEQEMLLVIFEDFCKTNASWIFDFLDAKPIECVAATRRALQSCQGKECGRHLGLYLQDTSNPGNVVQRIETQAQLCNFTTFLDDCLSNILVASCETNPEPGQVLLNTFSGTRIWWASKCSSSASCLFIWSNLVVIMIPMMLAQMLPELCP